MESHVCAHYPALLTKPLLAAAPPLLLGLPCKLQQMQACTCAVALPL